MSDGKITPILLNIPECCLWKQAIVRMPGTSWSYHRQPFDYHLCNNASTTSTNIAELIAVTPD
jgi:hypothetical protein